MAKFKSILELMDALPVEERVTVDMLREIIRSRLPQYCKEKISCNVPFFHGNKGICIIWPSSVPRGGIKSGVLLGFWYGNKLQDKNRYLTHGSNKQIYYKIFQSADEIDEMEITSLLSEALLLDKSFEKKPGQKVLGND